jgi:hypothetical protein
MKSIQIFFVGIAEPRYKFHLKRSVIGIKIPVNPEKADKRLFRNGFIF